VQADSKFVQADSKFRLSQLDANQNFAKSKEANTIEFAKDNIYYIHAARGCSIVEYV